MTPHSPGASGCQDDREKEKWPHHDLQKQATKKRLQTTRALLSGRDHSRQRRPPCETKRKTPPYGGFCLEGGEGKEAR